MSGQDRIKGGVWCLVGELEEKVGFFNSIGCRKIYVVEQANQFWRRFEDVCKLWASSSLEQKVKMKGEEKIFFRIQVSYVIAAISMH